MEKQGSKFRFSNEPKLSGHEADKDFDAKRLLLASKLEGFISTDKRFVEKEVTVTFVHKGISSLVSIIETKDEKLILKIPLSTKYAGGEASFLKTWAEAGVRTPTIFEEGILDGHSYMLMEYIDAPILSEAYTEEEFLAKEIYAEMGRKLRLMHTPKANGYGRPVEGHAEYTNFKDWLYGPDVEKMNAYVQKHTLLNEEHGSLADARKILLEHVNKNDASSYCHDDFGAANIFATEPITIFDPNPKFNNGYLDLGRTLVLIIRKGVYPEQLVEAYFENEQQDEKILRASIYLNAVMKLPYMHKTGKSELIQNLQNYLASRTFSTSSE